MKPTPPFVMAVALALAGCATPPQKWDTHDATKVEPKVYHPDPQQVHQADVAPRVAKRATIEIVSPPSDYHIPSGDIKEVPVRCLIRRMDTSSMEPIVIVHPKKWQPGQLDGGVLWVQAKPVWTGQGSDKDGYEYTVNAAFGEKLAGRGEDFEVFAMLVPVGNYREGRRLNEIPYPNDGVSNGIIVHRPQ